MPLSRIARLSRCAAWAPLGAGLVLGVLATGAAHAAGDVEAGRKTARMCQVCHGFDGIGKNPDVPNLAGESTRYIEKQLKAFKAGKRDDPQMSIIAKGLSAADIANVAAYYNAIEITATPPPK